MKIALLAIAFILINAASTQPQILTTPDVINAVTANDWNLVTPDGRLIVRFADQDSNPASSDQFRGPSLQMTGGVVRGIVDIEGGRPSANLRTSNLSVGAGDGKQHRGILALNPDIGAEIRLMNGHGRTCVKVLRDHTTLLDCNGHTLASFGPGKHITFFVKPRIRGLP